MNKTNNNYLYLLTYILAWGKATSNVYLADWSYLQNT